MSSTNPATPRPDYERLVAGLAEHRSDAQALLRAAAKPAYTNAPTQAQLALAHAATGILLMLETMAAEQAAELAAETQDEDPEYAALTVRLFHHNHGHTVPDGARSIRTFTKVYEFTIADLPRSGIDGTLEELVAAKFDRLAMNSTEPDVHRTRYRQLGNRALAEGDVVTIGDRYFAVAAYGLRERVTPLVEQPMPRSGTTPWLPADLAESIVDGAAGVPEGYVVTAVPWLLARRDCLDCHGNGALLVNRYAIDGEPEDWGNAGVWVSRPCGCLVCLTPPATATTNGPSA